MIRVNLLPHHLRPIKRSPLPYLASALVLAIAVLAMFTIWASKQSQISDKRRDMEAHQKEYDGLKPIVDEYNQLTDQKLKLADKISIIQEIVSDRIIWSRQLWNVSRLTPDNFWYKSVAEKETTTKESRLVYNEKTKKEEMKSVSIKHRVLQLSGYVIEGPDGSNDINPITFNMEQDAEFAAMFQLSSPKLVDSEFKGYKVRNFTLEYLINTGGEER
jgi:hypothetical protein